MSAAGRSAAATMSRSPTGSASPSLTACSRSVRSESSSRSAPQNGGAASALEPVSDTDAPASRNARISPGVQRAWAASTITRTCSGKRCFQVRTHDGSTWRSPVFDPAIVCTSTSSAAVECVFHVGFDLGLDVEGTTRPTAPVAQLDVHHGHAVGGEPVHGLAGLDRIPERCAGTEVTAGRRERGARSGLHRADENVAHPPVSAGKRECGGDRLGIGPGWREHDPPVVVGVEGKRLQERLDHFSPQGAVARERTGARDRLELVESPAVGDRQREGIRWRGRAGRAPHDRVEVDERHAVRVATVDRYLPVVATRREQLLDRQGQDFAARPGRLRAFAIGNVDQSSRTSPSKRASRWSSSAPRVTVPPLRTMTP